MFAARSAASLAASNGTEAPACATVAAVASVLGQRRRDRRDREQQRRRAPAPRRAGLKPRWRRPVHHRPKASSIAAASAEHHAVRRRSGCRAPRHSPSAVRNIGTARMCRIVSIHAPGLGSARRSAGTKPSSRNGIASPSPSPANTSSAAATGSTSAAPSAARHERPGARRRDEGGERAGPERAGRAALGGEPPPAITAPSSNSPARLKPIALSAAPAGR